MCGSTCFGRLSAHHQEPLVLMLESGDSSVVGRGLAGYDNLPDYDQQRSNRHSPTVKPEAPSTVVRSL